MIDQTAAWKALESHLQDVAPMRELFDHDPDRFTRFSVQACDLFLDYSKNRVTDQTMDLLFGLAREAGVAEGIAAMFGAQRINTTEERAVLHCALRAEEDDVFLLDGENVVPEVQRVLRQMDGFTRKVRSGEWTGFSGKRITDVVNIGIGGSDLGPKMVTEALGFYRDRNLRFHFVSNIDGTHIARVLDEVGDAVQ